MLVAAERGFACIRIIGRANFTSAVDFKTLINELQDRGCECFALDLSDCVLMDSTFLGLLAGLGLKVSSGNGGSERRVELFNPSARIMELLETLGVLRLFKIVHGSATAAASGEAVQHPASAPSKAEVARTCIEAHQTLMGLNPANVAKFKDVAAFLAEGLKEAETQ